jgi:septal ring-binding cell division protein DamX
LDNVYFCPVRQGGQDVWVVMYGSFPGASSARLAIDSLPQKLRRFQPFVRRFGELFRGVQPNGGQTAQGIQRTALQGD